MITAMTIMKWARWFTLVILVAFTVGWGLSAVAVSAQATDTEPEEAYTKPSVSDLQSALQTTIDESAEPDWKKAVQYYTALIERVGTSVSDKEHKILARHVAQLRLVLPDEVRHELAWDTAADELAKWSFPSEEVGAELTKWLRSQDPLPSTGENERVQEHVRRIAVAEEHYGHERRPTGLDDRGETYVRFGTPARSTEIDYTDYTFQSEVFRFGIFVGPNDFPDHEIWFYDHIDRNAYYIFVERGPYYREGTTRDLLPQRLRSGFQGDRGANHAYSAMYAMQHIYRQLASEHSNFGARYSSIANYTDLQESFAMMEDMGQTFSGNRTEQEVGDGFGQSRRVYEDPAGGVESPVSMVRQVLQTSRIKDQQAQRQREQSVPASHSEVLDHVGDLDVNHRTVRFLGEDGTTRTEVYWEMPNEQLSLTEGQSEAIAALEGRFEGFLVRASAMQRNQAYENEVHTVNHHPVAEITGGQYAATEHTLDVEGSTTLYHIGLQWDQFLFSETEGLGPIARIGTARVDSVRTLDPERLEMSDLKPLQYASGQTEWMGEHQTPMLKDTLSPDQPLALYFEVYNLLFNEDDRTAYAIEYEVQTTEPRGGIAGWIRSDRVQQTATETIYESANRQTEEYMLIDLEEIAPDRSSEVDIIVRVTDQTSGNQVERTLSFTLNPLS